MLHPRIAQAALATGFALLVLHAARSGFDHDEVEHLHAAWLVSQGQTPYHDFFEQHHPPLFYLLAPLAGVLQGSPRALVFAARALNLMLLGVVLAVFTALVRPLLRDRRSAWAPLLLVGCFFFARNSMEVRPDPWMSLFCVLGVWQWVTYLRSVGGARHAALAGLCFGAAIAFLPKAIFFVGLVGLGTALAVRGRAAWIRAAGGAGVLVAAALVPVGALLLAIWRSGSWSDFVLWNYTFNKFYYLETHFDGPSALAMLAVCVGESPLLWIGGLVGVGLTARSLWRGQTEPALAIAAVVTVGFIGVMFVTRWPFNHNLLLMQPLLALLAAVVLDRLEAPGLRTAVGVLLLLMVVKVCILCLVYTEGHGSEGVQRQLLQRTQPGDAVAAAPPYNPIFRPDAFFFWYVPESNSIAYLEFCRRRGLEPTRIEEDRRIWRERPPRFVYVPEDEPSWAPFEFAQHRSAYRMTDVPGLWELGSSQK
jgi:4-amino-4-deoxy-L-arabinose transferase-like glycosyltransferase